MQDYNVVIERGHSPINDRIIDFLKTKITGRYIDIGANTGWLVSEVPGGVGLEPSHELVGMAVKLKRNVMLGNALDIPFKSKSFDIAVLSCVLEQMENWEGALLEAKRVARKVIGVNPYPGSPWGKIGGWVKSVIPPEHFKYTEKIDDDRYYFEL